MTNESTNTTTMCDFKGPCSTQIFWRFGRDVDTAESRMQIRADGRKSAKQVPKHRHTGTLNSLEPQNGTVAPRMSKITLSGWKTMRFAKQQLIHRKTDDQNGLHGGLQGNHVQKYGHILSIGCFEIGIRNMETGDPKMDARKCSRVLR